MTSESLLIYIATVFIASIIPGPSMLLALNHGIRYGVRISIITALGNTAATLIQAILSIIGLSIVLIKISMLFSVIKYAGAAYIIYIGIMTLLNSADPSEKAGDGKTGKEKASAIFRESFLVTMGNPKAIIFFTALFPQFISTNNETALSSFILIALLLLIAFTCMMIYIVFGQSIQKILTSRKRKIFFNRIVGFSFLGLGLGLMFGRVEK
jgi:threonine/homoserine/homoserine lactone efflux protein